MTNKTTTPRRKSKKSQSICPDVRKSAHSYVSRRSLRYGPPTWEQAVTEAWASERMIRVARWIAHRYDVDPEELRQAAAERALRVGPTPCAAKARFAGCMRSIGSTWARSRVRAAEKGERDTNFMSDEKAALCICSILPPDIASENAWRMDTVLRGFEAVAMNDNRLEPLVDVMIERKRGRVAHSLLGLSQIEYESRKRKLQRQIHRQFADYVVEGRLMLDRPPVA